MADFIWMSSAGRRWHLFHRMHRNGKAIEAFIEAVQQLAKRKQDEKNERYQAIETLLSCLHADHEDTLQFFELYHIPEWRRSLFETLPLENTAGLERQLVTFAENLTAYTLLDRQPAANVSVRRELRDKRERLENTIAAIHSEIFTTFPDVNRTLLLTNPGRRMRLPMGKALVL